MRELSRFENKDSLPCFHCGKKAHVFVHYGTDYDYNSTTKRRETREIWIGLCQKHLEEWKLSEKVKANGIF